MDNNLRKYLNEVSEKVKEASSANKPFILKQPVRDLSLQFIMDQISQTPETEQIAVVLPMTNITEIKRQLEEFIKNNNLEDRVKLISPRAFETFKSSIDEDLRFSKCFFADTNGWDRRSSHEEVLDSPYMNDADIIVCTCEPTDTAGRSVDHRFPDAIVKANTFEEIAPIMDIKIKQLNTQTIGFDTAEALILSSKEEDPAQKAIEVEKMLKGIVDKLMDAECKGKLYVPAMRVTDREGNKVDFSKFFASAITDETSEDKLKAVVYDPKISAKEYDKKLKDGTISFVIGGKALSYVPLKEINNVSVFRHVTEVGDFDKALSLSSLVNGNNIVLADFAMNKELMAILSEEYVTPEEKINDKMFQYVSEPGTNERVGKIKITVPHDQEVEEFFKKLGINTKEINATQFGFQPATDLQAIIMAEVCHSYGINIPESIDLKEFPRAVLEKATEVAMNRSIIVQEYGVKDVEHIDQMLSSGEYITNKPLSNPEFFVNETAKENLNKIADILNDDNLRYINPKTSLDARTATPMQKEFVSNYLNLPADISDNLTCKQASQLITEMCHREAANLAGLDTLLYLNENKADKDLNMSSWSKEKAENIKNNIGFYQSFNKLNEIVKESAAHENLPYSVPLSWMSYDAIDKAFTESIEKDNRPWDLPSLNNIKSINSDIYDELLKNGNPAVIYLKDFKDECHVIEQDGHLFITDKNEETLLAHRIVDYDKNFDNIAVVPDTIKNIYPGAFQAYGTVKKVVVPDNIENIFSQTAKIGINFVTQDRGQNEKLTNKFIIGLPVFPSGDTVTSDDIVHSAAVLGVDIDKTFRIIVPEGVKNIDLGFNQPQNIRDFRLPSSIEKAYIMGDTQYYDNDPLPHHAKIFIGEKLYLTTSEARFEMNDKNIQIHKFGYNEKTQQEFHYNYTPQEKLIDEAPVKLSLRDKVLQLSNNNDTESKTNNLSFRKDDLDI